MQSNNFDHSPPPPRPMDFLIEPAYRFPYVMIFAAMAVQLFSFIGSVNDSLKSENIYLALFYKLCKGKVGGAHLYAIAVDVPVHKWQASYPSYTSLKLLTQIFCCNLYIILSCKYHCRVAERSVDTIILSGSSNHRGNPVVSI